MLVSYRAGFDSPGANNSSLNPISINLGGGQQIESVIITFDPTSLDGMTAGDYLLENDAPDGTDSDTTVIIDGERYTFSLFTTGTFPIESGNDSGKIPGVLEGVEVFVIRIENYDIDGDGTRDGPMQFYFAPDFPYDSTNESPESAAIPGVQNAAIDIGLEIDDPEPICFLLGTMIETPNGPVAVEDLTEGDLVMTAENGAQPLIWVTSTKHVWPGSDDKHKPIMIKQGALGEGLPTADLIVSPQHHMVIEGQTAFDMFEQRQVLAPAKGLTHLAGIRAMKGRKKAEYFHLLLPVHDVLIAHGAKTESFYPGPTALRMMSTAQCESLYTIVPALRDDPENGYGATALKKITRRQAEALVKALRAKTSDQNKQPELALVG